MQPVHPEHELYSHFSGLLHESASVHGLSGVPEVEAYIADLLVRFVHRDNVFAVRRDGRPLESVIEMSAEADIRLNADSFEREREVHRHIGDYILFWGSVYPDFLRRLRLGSGLDLVCDYTEQGRSSYFVVSTFDYPPYADEAGTFRALSEGFEEFSIMLKDVASTIPRSA